MDYSVPVTTKCIASTAACLESLLRMQLPQLGLTAIATKLNEQLAGTGVEVTINWMEDGVASFHISVLETSPQSA